VKLHYTQGSPFARIARVLIRELGIDCEEIRLAGFPPPASFFALNPLGQVPALETDDGVRFPTRLIVDYLLANAKIPPFFAPTVRRTESFWQDEQILTVLLAMGDTLANIKYQQWAGLRPGGENLIGYNPSDRNTERVTKTLDWLEARAGGEGFLPGVLSVQDIAFSSIVMWIDARGGFPWRGRKRLEAIASHCAERASFKSTAPQPWP
jgi:glutathione S-transferase